jgi:DNA-binding winged helix-turn-helix (wHTH) protein/TolB-like protein/Tfp pilus assembly protein PilF
MEPAPTPETSRPFNIGDWRVDPKLDEISRGDLVLKLEPRMVRLLARLAENPGEVVSTQQLLESVWPDVVVGPASVYQAISHLRKLLGDTGATPTCIATVTKKGYRLIAPVRAVEPPAQPVPALPPPAAVSAPTAVSPLKWILGAAIALPLLALTWWLIPPREEPQPTTPPPEIAASDTNSHTIAVLPFTAANAGESNAAAADSFFLLLRDRLADSADTRVINYYSAIKASRMGVADAAIGEQLRARYLVRGETASMPDSVHVKVSVFDVLTAREIWSKTRDAPLTDMAETAESLAQQLAQLLRMTLPRREIRQLDPYAYPLYAKGLVLLGTVTYADNQAAQDLFRRSIAMDPDFARGHLGLGQALTQFDRLKDYTSHDPPPEARQAIARALDLDPRLGAGWSERALMETDPVRAEQLYLRGLALSPNEVFGYWAYADFLKNQRRGDEAIRMLDRARALDPMLAALNDLKKYLVITQDQDIGEYEHLLRETIAIAPDHPSAMVELGAVRFYQHGELAQGLLLAERAARAPAQSGAPGFLLARMYLELGMADAARDANLSATQPFINDLLIDMFVNDLDAAMAVVRAHIGEFELFNADLPSSAHVVRDYALARGTLPDAVKILDQQYEKIRQQPLMQTVTMGLVLAHTLKLSGQKERGIKLARDILAAIDAEVARQGPQWWAFYRATALLVLGDDDGALAALESLEKVGGYSGWWYPAERDSLFASIRNHPRFRAIVNRSNSHRDQQVVLINELIKKGEIPKRPAN